VAARVSAPHGLSELRQKAKGERIRMRVGSLTVFALLAALASAVPAGLVQRGARKCVCTRKAAGHNSGSKVVYDGGSSSGSSWSGTGGSGGWVQDSKGSGMYVKTVVYVNLVPVLVPVTTTCLQTGTIIIENDITINVTIAPTVFYLEICLSDCRLSRILRQQARLRRKQQPSPPIHKQLR
jgi:hypothetical protein